MHSEKLYSHFLCGSSKRWRLFLQIHGNLKQPHLSAELVAHGTKGIPKHYMLDSFCALAEYPWFLEIFKCVGSRHRLIRQVWEGQQWLKSKIHSVEELYSRGWMWWINKIKHKHVAESIKRNVSRFCVKQVYILSELNKWHPSSRSSTQMFIGFKYSCNQSKLIVIVLDSSEMLIHSTAV